MISIEDKIFARIKGYGKGWVMTNSDFSDLGLTSSIASSLHRLKERNVIRPLLKGIYYFPRFSELLQEEMAPDIEMVARAIARKFQWHIQISGNAALNYLGVSTQVPMRTIYFSDGPSRSYKIFERVIEFKHVSLKEAKFSYPQSEIVVQALKELGENHVTEEVMAIIRKQLSKSEREKILKDTRFVTDWIHDKIKSICTVEEANG